MKDKKEMRNRLRKFVGLVILANEIQGDNCTFDLVFTLQQPF